MLRPGLNANTKTLVQFIDIKEMLAKFRWRYLQFRTHPMLKWYLIIAAVVFAGYQWKYRHSEGHLEEIANPVYVEYRMDLDAGGRTLNAVLFGKMASRRECEREAEQIWRESLSECEVCQFKSSSCQKELPSRYAGIFDDKPLNTTYISFNRGDARERDGRMVLWGMNDAEAEMVCEVMRKGMDQKYRGEVSCVVGGG